MNDVLIVLISNFGNVLSMFVVYFKQIFIDIAILAAKFLFELLNHYFYNFNFSRGITIFLRSFYFVD